MGAALALAFVARTYFPGIVLLPPVIKVTAFASGKGPDARLHANPEASKKHHYRKQISRFGFEVAPRLLTFHH
jgi:hypothetical protein